MYAYLCLSCILKCLFWAAYISMTSFINFFVCHNPVFFPHNTSFHSKVLCLPVVPIADSVPLISSLVTSYPAGCTYSGITSLVKRVGSLEYRLPIVFFYITCISLCVSLLWLLGNLHICNIVNFQLFCFSYRRFILFDYCDCSVTYTCVTLRNVLRCLLHWKNFAQMLISAK